MLYLDYLCYGGMVRFNCGSTLGITDDKWLYASVLLLQQYYLQLVEE